MFGDAALRLCNAAAVLLGWRPEEFWKATPAELATALVAPGGDAAFSLEELKSRFPDEVGLDFTRADQASTLLS